MFVVFLLMMTSTSKLGVIFLGWITGVLVPLGWQGELASSCKVWSICQGLVSKSVGIMNSGLARQISASTVNIVVVWTSLLLFKHSMFQHSAMVVSSLSGPKVQDLDDKRFQLVSYAGTGLNSSVKGWGTQRKTTAPPHQEESAEVSRAYVVVMFEYL